MSRRKSDTFGNLATGIFMLAVLALMGYFTIVISGVDLLTGQERVEAEIVFDQVGGLKDHDNVMYRGTKVGIVERVDVTPSNLVVCVSIDKSVVLREGYRATVCSLSFLGGNYLVLEEGKGRVLDFTAAPLRGETPSDWMRDVAEVAKNLRRISGDAGLRAVVTNAEAATAKMLAIADRIQRGEGTVGRLIMSDDALYNDLRAAMSDARTSAASFKEAVSNATAITAGVRRGEGMVGRLLREGDPMYANVSNVVANSDLIVERLKNGEGLAGRLLAKDDPIYDEFRGAVASFKKACEGFDLGDEKENVREVVASANRLMNSLNAVAGRLERGEGTLGKMMTDDGLYDKVDGLMLDVRQIIDNYRDTTPIATFGSLATGAL